MSSLNTSGEQDRPSKASRTLSGIGSRLKSLKSDVSFVQAELPHHISDILDTSEDSHQLPEDTERQPDFKEEATVSANNTNEKMPKYTTTVSVAASSMFR